jgi:hypothetical protein
VEIKSAYAKKHSYMSQLIGDAIACYSAGLIAYLLIRRPVVYKLLFEKRDEVKNKYDNGGES